ncbi:hypothetical protein NXS19_001853 [Fusarium pseudograminearum]|nr:hypothetical protein NXS19_001853 [Fusarium pseudograminearum]
MEARCQCGSVTFKTPLPQPLALYICHCDACRRQTGSAFGTSAIFPRFELPDTDLLSVYSRPTASGHQLYCYFCRKCGTRLIHSTPSKNVISVKGAASTDWTGNESGYTDYGSTQEELDQPGDLVGSAGCNIPPSEKIGSSSVEVNGGEN